MLYFKNKLFNFFTIILCGVFTHICGYSIKWPFKSRRELLKETAINLCGKQNAPTKYQVLGQEAQAIVGIPANQQVIIKKLKPTAIQYKTDAACTCGGQIFVNQEWLEKQKRSHGYLRILMTHEAEHKKQADLHNGETKCINTKYPTIEKEADLEAAKRCNCSLCTLDFAAYAFRANDTSEKARKSHTDGYATREELLEIAEQQKACNALCKHHQKN